jgi:hypothetical protein
LQLAALPDKMGGAVFCAEKSFDFLSLFGIENGVIVMHQEEVAYA